MKRRPRAMERVWKKGRGKERERRGDGRSPAAGRTIAALRSVADKQIAN